MVHTVSIDTIMDHGKIKYPGVFPLSLESRWLTLATSIAISDTIGDSCGSHVSLEVRLGTLVAPH